MSEQIMRPGRLNGKVAFVTGAAGNIGTAITRRFLEEGASVVMTGRNTDKLAEGRARLLADVGAHEDRVLTVAMDGAEASHARAAIAAAMARYGRVDVVVNNAGSAGPRQKLENVPITSGELAALRAAGATDTETAGDAARNLLAVTWNVVRAAVPVLKAGASVINVSTIFSRTEYFGRTAYVVPKAALNALSRRLATELGELGIRVNTVFPGPIASDRIRTVFAAMDKLREEADGTTAAEFFELMSLARAVDGRPPERTFPTVLDVANVLVFLASDESAALNGHDLEVTHGMAVRKESRSTWLSRPVQRIVDGSGRTVFMAGGEQVADALAVARIQAATGATVLLGLERDEHVRHAASILTNEGGDLRIRPVLVDRTRPATLAAALEGSAGRVDGAIIMPSLPAGQLRGLIKDALDADIDHFIDREVIGAIAIARELTRYWQTVVGQERGPRVVFLSNGDDGAGNVYADAMRAALEELCRVWRHESETRAKKNPDHQVEWSNQIVRYTNREAEALAFAGGQAARLLFTPRHIRQVNLYLPSSIVDATGARRATMGWMDSLQGLHLGKVALVTGGSAGIGGQIGRLLACAGARVMLVSRGVEQLQETRDRIVAELEDCGYSGARRRVQTLAGVDVADLTSAEHAVDVTLQTFGRIDYLVNCAGVAGAEEMVVDMGITDWRRTLDANLVSNYALIQKIVPHMKAQGSGYIVNVSSYFGGEKYVATPYPNRADYAVSKAGQRALAENLARFLGPEIQINAIAPGPVAGDRLRGKDGKPGLYERRGRLILENKRLNGLHAAVVESIRRGAGPGEVLDLLAKNDVVALQGAAGAPAPLRALAAKLSSQGRDGSSCGRFLLTTELMGKLVARLKNGGYLTPDDGERFGAAWLASLPAPTVPFLAASDINAAANKVRQDVLGLLHLQKMPTEMEVALAAVFYLADRAASGETFLPSGGLSLERSNTERELFGSVKRERLEMMKGHTVWLVGEHLVAHLAHAATVLVETAHVGRLVFLMRTAEADQALRARLPAEVLAKSDTVVAGDRIEEAMDEAQRRHGYPNTVISTAFGPLPSRVFGAAEAPPPLDTAGFQALIETNITHHFRVARKAVLFDHVQLLLVSPDVPANSSAEAFALANFVKTTLHAFTGTIAVECERLVHDSIVNQINLTRRVRSEEPRDDAETAEELERFGRAVLLAGAPLPSLEDSRYRSRIYRGMAITV
jgi:malonyl-CoA reductase / 3-hydroxypropionate dehydrogenase (NADP+)